MQIIPTREDEVAKRKKQQKMDFDQMKPLKQSPFAALGTQFGIEAPAEVDHPASQEKTSHPPRVSVLVREEKRAKGKIMTCIYHCEGVAQELLKELKKRLATGGALIEGGIALQGRHRDAVKGFLEQKGYKVR